MKLTTFAGLLAAVLLSSCYDQEAVEREAEDLRLADGELQAAVDAGLADIHTRLDALEAETDTRLAALEAAVGIPYGGAQPLEARVEDIVASIDGFASEDWVDAQGFLTAESDPVATAAGYLTEESDPIATNAGYLTEELDPIATSAGYLTSFTESDPIATSAGYLTAYTETDPVAMAEGFLTEETDPVATAAGYLTSFTETDPIATTAGYLTSFTETDPIATAAGYLTAETDPIATTSGYLTEEDLEACPLGYVQDISETGFTLCYDPDSAFMAEEMVRVGDFWIDRYEASVWEDADCSGAQWGGSADDYPTELPDTGNWTSAEAPAYACSVAGVTPSRFLTWFQAQQSCAASGKDLCTNEQWQAAAAGTWDPGAYDGNGGGACFTDTTGVRQTGNAGDTPGGPDSCISAWGAEDMVGNRWEWTADWFVAGLSWSTNNGDQATPWPAGYGDDRTWNVDGRAFNGADWVDGIPAAALRGGSSGQGTGAGVFSFFLNSDPAFYNSDLSFRCCRGR